MTHPPVAGRADHGVDAERLADLVAVDGIDAGDVFGPCTPWPHTRTAGRSNPDRGSRRGVPVGRATARRRTERRPAAAVRPRVVGSARGRTELTRCRRRPPVPSARRSPTPSRRHGRPAGGPDGGLRRTSPTTSWMGKPCISAAQIPVSPGSRPLRTPEAGKVAPADARREEAQQNLAVDERVRRWLRQFRSLERVRRDEPIGPHRQTSTGMLFQPHWKLDGGRDAASLTTRQSGTRLSHSVTMMAISRRARCTPRQKCCPLPNASSRSMGRFQMNSSGSVYSRSSRLADAEQRDDPLTRLDRRAVNGERLAHSAREPLRGRAVADHLLARHGHVGVEIRTHRGHLVGPPTQLPQPVRHDLRHGFRSADEDAEHLDGGFHVGEARNRPAGGIRAGRRRSAARHRTPRRACVRTIGVRYSR